MLSNFTNNHTISKVIMDPKTMNNQRLQSLSSGHVGNGHVANIEYSTSLTKVVAVKSMDLEAGVRNLLNVSLPDHYGIIKVDVPDASPIFFQPQGNLDYCKEGMPREDREYIELNRMLESTIFSVINKLTFNENSTTNDLIKRNFKEALTTQKFTDLAIQAYIKFKGHNHQLKLALVQILWLYIHDDLRDEKASPLHTNPKVVNLMNKALSHYLNNPTSTADPFLLPEEVRAEFKTYPKLLPKLRLLEGLTTEYKHQLDAMFSNPEDDALHNIKSQMKQKLLTDIELYFRANYKEAEDAKANKTCTSMAYEDQRKQNSAVPLCATLGETFLALNHDDPTYAWFQILELHSIGAYTEVHDDMSLHIGAANCVFSAIREFINGDATNLVTIFKTQDSKRELTWEEAYREATNYVNGKYMKLIHRYQQLKTELLDKTEEVLRAPRKPADIVADLRALNPSDYGYGAQYTQLIFEQNVVEFFHIREQTRENKNAFLKMHPQLQNFGFIFDWTDGNIHFSTHAPRYKAEEQRFDPTKAENTQVMKDALVCKTLSPEVRGVFSEHVSPSLYSTFHNTRWWMGALVLTGLGWALQQRLSSTPMGDG